MPPRMLRILTLFLLAPVIAPQQQEQDALRRSSPQENPALRPLTQNSPSKSLSKNERAVATVAPAAFDAAVRASNPAKSAAAQASSNAGLSARPGQARSLQDWEVENFVLLATVDGSIYARDRTTGHELWKFNTETPMVETIYHTRHSSNIVDDNDQWMWIVEPNQDGSLYIFIPGPDAGIQKLGPTVKELADKLSPWVSEESPFVYTAEKRNTLITLNATNGVAIKYFSAGSSGFVDSRSCRSVKALEMEEDDECEPTPTINIGRTEYTVSIQDKDTGDGICTIKYFEWTPNNRDRDLQSQYSSTMDNKYIYSRYDGGVIALEHTRDQKNRDNHFLFSKKFASPVVRVFDVARPQGLDSREIPLVLLPQPIAPVLKREEVENVFVNCTESGSWYALSESSYPTVTDGASEAKCYASLFSEDPFEPSDETFKPSALVGIHSLSESNRKKQSVPSIGAPYDPVLVDAESVSGKPQLADTKDMRYVIDGPKPSEPARSFGTAGWTGGVFLLFIAVLTLFKNNLNVPSIFGETRQSSLVTEPMVPSEVSSIDSKGKREMNNPDTEVNMGEPIIFTANASQREVVTANADQQEVVTENIMPTAPSAPAINENTLQAATASNVNSTQNEEAATPEAIIADAVEQATAEPKKKKTHRGSRGAHKRKMAKQKAAEEGKTQVEKIEEGNNAVRPDSSPPLPNGDSQNIQPDRIGDLIVYPEKVLGRGSGGTTVFEGSYGGRDVAVKRMLIQFYELAFQEVTLLEQTDHHRNIVRYYSQQRDQHFLYIAVEKCRASLFDLYGNGPPMELQPDHEQCRNEINLNVVGALRQLASGLQHLHSLRIIHRDIKPQNILVAKSRPNEGLRLVVSDFGLCRTLPEHASTLVGTAATGAGTSGWKAPELIRNPKEISTLSSTPDEISNNSNDGSGSQAGVKRAVDIFSLGCVFYYILTNGHHPFDSESAGYYQWEREHRIRLGKSDFDKLSQMGADAEEPGHLVKWMVSHNPEDRPSAGNVLNHPFFWTPKQRLDFLCDVSDHWEREPRDPPSEQLEILESYGEEVHGGNFLALLDRKFVDTLGKQRKYFGYRMLDLLRALRNKKNHYADMPEDVQHRVGELPAGYLNYWTHRFPMLLISCYKAVMECGLEKDPRFKPYLEDHLSE